MADSSPRSFPVSQAYLYLRAVAFCTGLLQSEFIYLNPISPWLLNSFFPVWHSSSCQPAPEALQTSLGILRSSWSMCKGCLFSSRPFLEPLSKLLVPGNLISRIHFCSDVNPDFFLREDGVGGRSGLSWEQSWTVLELNNQASASHTPRASFPCGCRDGASGVVKRTASTAGGLHARILLAAELQGLWTLPCPISSLYRSHQGPERLSNLLEVTQPRRRRAWIVKESDWLKSLWPARLCLASAACAAVTLVWSLTFSACSAPDLLHWLYPLPETCFLPFSWFRFQLTCQFIKEDFPDHPASPNSASHFLAHFSISHLSEATLSTCYVRTQTT